MALWKALLWIAAGSGSISLALNALGGPLSDIWALVALLLLLTSYLLWRRHVPRS